MKFSPIKVWTDQELEVRMAWLLRFGVIASSIVVLAGGIYYLIKYGAMQPAYHEFRGEPERFKSFGGIVGSAFGLSARGIIDIGVLLLIATPIARVAFSLVAFARERDRLFVTVTMIVLGVLLFDLLGGYG